MDTLQENLNSLQSNVALRGALVARKHKEQLIESYANDPLGGIDMSSGALHQVYTDHQDTYASTVGKYQQVQGQDVGGGITMDVDEYRRPGGTIGFICKWTRVVDGVTSVKTENPQGDFISSDWIELINE